MTREEKKEDGSDNSEENGENNVEEVKTTIYYVTDEQQQSQYINMFKAQGQDAVILGHNIDSPFITQSGAEKSQYSFPAY